MRRCRYYHCSEKEKARRGFRCNDCNAYVPARPLACDGCRQKTCIDCLEEKKCCKRNFCGACESDRDSDWESELKCTRCLEVLSCEKCFCTSYAAPFYTCLGFLTPKGHRDVLFEHPVLCPSCFKEWDGRDVDFFKEPFEDGDKDMCDCFPEHHDDSSFGFDEEDFADGRDPYDVRHVMSKRCFHSMVFTARVRSLVAGLCGITRRSWHHGSHERGKRTDYERDDVVRALAFRTLSILKRNPAKDGQDQSEGSSDDDEYEEED
jgi:hypothetical protein